jgi:hypothetical protein
MPKLPGINHQRAVNAFQKAGFRVAREGKHITMTNGERIITIQGQILSMPLQWVVLSRIPDLLSKSSKNYYSDR